MKKLLTTGLLLGLCAVLVLTGCSNTVPGSTETQQPAEQVTALEVLQKVWDSYDEADRFPAAGGDYENIVEDAPGTFSLVDSQSVEIRTFLPEEQQTNVTEAAALFHLMNSNTFSAAAFHLAENADQNAVADAVAQFLAGHHWMCGWPEKYTLLVVNGDTLVTVLGAAELVDTFTSQTKAQFENTVTLKDASLMPDGDF